ncbi:MAG: OmpP1/FadL family transporter [Candidatus Anammoxibacter sp.]
MVESLIDKPKLIHVVLLVCIMKLAAFGWFVNSANADGVVFPSIGAVSSGRGGVNVAFHDNGVLIHDNPAALVNMEAGKLLDFGFEFFYPEIRYSDGQGTDYSKHQIFSVPTFSFVYKKSEESRFAFGVGAFAPAGFATEYRLNHLADRKFPFNDSPLSFGRQKYSSQASLLKILFSTSYKITNRLSAGFSIGPSIQTLAFEMPYTFQKGIFAGISVLSDVDYHTGFGLSYTMGAQYKISENTVLGLTFVSESKTTLKGKADITLPRVLGFNRILRDRDSEYDVKSNFEWPRSLGIGISHKLGKADKFAFDLLWFDWASAFDRLDLELTDGDNPLFNLVLGGTVNDALPLDWDSSFSFRFGYEHFFKGKIDDIVRLGYIFNQNPVPHKTQIPLIPGTLKHNFSIGYTHRWDKWQFDVASQIYISDTKPVGNSEIVGNDFSNSSLKTRAYFLFLGMKYHF